MVFPHNQEEVKMSDIINPMRAPSSAAYQAALELVKAGKISNATMFNLEFTQLLDHFRAEYTRVNSDNKES